ncbi:M23 family metallopeptidase [Pannus brasiliensis CCIBt3594]|uniref:M23 family metallopeptidase n=1 Tax=Pannus brasiliensis CCIBt3594 TaxID=1427578 RepID=A0AAW9R0W0_9CHRO
MSIVLLCAGIARFTPAQAQNAWAGASFPVENFQAYTSGFGYRASPVDGRQQFHYGLDMAAPMGSYIRNWWAGQIVELSDNTACGTMIQVQSGQWTHIYCHLMGYVVSDNRGTFLVDRDGGIILAVGQEIPAGARMARVGMTGRTTGPHLHWGLKYSGQYVDPALVLNAMYGSLPSGNS